MEELKGETKTLRSPFCPHPLSLQNAMVFFGYNSVYLLYNFTPIFPFPIYSVLLTGFYVTDLVIQYSALPNIFFLIVSDWLLIL